MSPDKQPATESMEKQALTEHLRDLRTSLIRSLIAVAIGFGVSYYFIEQIGVWFLHPLFAVLPKNASLIFTSYQEGFFFI
ncbi:MAG: twin-arginine translocase subunit TatC [Deltaproteobacteria bacterium]|nr:twin-arginine translocase subunit TatC [Deltaproteobacteria bacterium]